MLSSCIQLFPHLHMPVYESVELEIIIVLPEWVDQSLRHLQPAEEEGELGIRGLWPLEQPQF